MEPENESSIPNQNPRKTLKTLAIIGALLLVLVIGLLLSLKKQTNKNQDQQLTQQSNAQIEITKDGFLPAALTVPKGTKVTWTNKDDKPHRVASNPHPEHTGLSGLDSKDVIGIEGGTYSYTFDKPGEYTYHDHLNPLLNGTVKVQ